MSKRHIDRPDPGTISVEARRLAGVSCPHRKDKPCYNCLRECQREINASQKRASDRRLGK